MPRIPLRVVVLALVAWGQAVPSGASDVVTVRDAIVLAAAARMGVAAVAVDVDALTSSIGATPALVAVPDPAAAVGRPARFALIVDGHRAGVAVATVRVKAQVAIVTRPIERGSGIEAGDVTLAERELDNVRFSRVPSLDEVIGSRARRELAPGTVLTSGHIVVPPAVRSGDEVTAGVTIGRVHVTATAVASGSGQVGDVIYVLQPGRRTRLKARVIEAGVVEVVP